MAVARMLHKTITRSMDVHALPVKARLLFTWMIPFADDEGRLLGNASYIRASAMPLENLSLKKIKMYLEMMAERNLIHYWQENGENYIEFIGWNTYQKLRKERIQPSKYPKYKSDFDDKLSRKWQRSDNALSHESNVTESKRMKVNKSECNMTFADKNPNRVRDVLKKKCQVQPELYPVRTAAETAALEIYKQLEPQNPLAFYTTYLVAAHKGVSADLMHQWKSEILQSESVINPGMVFNSKLKEYLKLHETKKLF